jgi:acyl-CoA thioesterase II
MIGHDIKPWYYRCVVAYASDLLYSGVSLNPHREKGLKTYSLSLDHSIWFHKPVKADDWLLYVIDSPSAHGGRGFVTGRMFNRQGEVYAFVVSKLSSVLHCFCDGNVYQLTMMSSQLL